MLVLGIETSCDETAISLVENGKKIVSNIVSSSLHLHRKYGGIVPEIATRYHVELINYVLAEAEDEAGVKLRDIDLVACVYGPGLVGALLIAQVPTALGVAHRWRPVGEGMVVTRAEGSRIIELDNTPAIQAYVRVLGALAVEIPDEALGRMALTNPLGIPEVTGEYQLRHPISAQDDGSILCAASIAEGSVVRMMTATVNESVRAVRKATRAALAGLGRAEPALAIVFNWGVRLVLRPMEEMRQDVSAIREEIGPDVPMAGFFTYGEQASTPGGPVSFHNESCVIYVVGR